MSNANITHEIISINPDVDVHLDMSIDQGSYVAPHWHNSIELVYMIEGSMEVYFENDIHPTSKKYQKLLYHLKEDFREMYEVYVYQPKGYLLRFYSFFYDFCILSLPIIPKQCYGKMLPKMKKS